MAEIYDIMYDGAIVGSAKMEKQGLYHAFSCRCRLPEDGLYRIHVICGEKFEDLGICIPMGDTVGMDKKLAAKKLGEGPVSFELHPKDWVVEKPVIKVESIPVEVEAPPEEPHLLQEEPQPETETAPPESEEEKLPQTVEAECFIPVSEEKPFDYLDKLENARMEIRDDVAGIILSEMEQGRQ